MTVGRIEQLTNMPTDYTEEYIAILERKLTAVTHYNAAECIAVLERKVATLEAENATLRKLVQHAVDAETAVHNSEQRAARLDKALRGLYDHCKNNMQICGLLVAAKEALGIMPIPSQERTDNEQDDTRVA